MKSFLFIFALSFFAASFAAGGPLDRPRVKVLGMPTRPFIYERIKNKETMVFSNQVPEPLLRYLLLAGYGINVEMRYCGLQRRVIATYTRDLISTMPQAEIPRL